MSEQLSPKPPEDGLVVKASEVEEGTTSDLALPDAATEPKVQGKEYLILPARGVLTVIGNGLERP